MFSKVRASLTLDDARRAIVYSQMDRTNLTRMTSVMWIGPLVSLAHIILFAAGLPGSVGTERVWRLAILISHTVLMALILGAGFGARGADRATRLSTHVLYCGLLILGAGIAVADQLVTTAITPFVIVNVLVPLLFVVNFFHAVVYHLVAYSVFVVGVIIVQADGNAVLSGQVNGLTVASVGVLLAYIMWNSAKMRILQQHRIDTQTRALEEAGAAKDRLFAIIAHDLRGPIGGFAGLTAMLAAEDDTLSSDERISWTAVLSRSAQALYDMLENLLSWAKAQQGMLHYSPEDVDVNETLRKLYDAFAPIAVRKRISLNVDCASELTVVADPHLLAAVLRNLVSNSLKFTPPGGTVTLRAQRKESGVEFECIDTGIGITDEIRAQLLQLDRKAVRPGTEGESSGGLGLLLSRDYVQRLGGELDFTSTPGVETRFRFTVPDAEISDDRTENHE